MIGICGEIRRDVICILGPTESEIVLFYYTCATHRLLATGLYLVIVLDALSISISDRSYIASIENFSRQQYLRVRETRAIPHIRCAYEINAAEKLSGLFSDSTGMWHPFRKYHNFCNLFA